MLFVQRFQSPYQSLNLSFHHVGALGESLQMSVEDREDLSISKRNFNLQNCALEIEVAFDRVSGRARELIASRLPEAISREEDELSAGCSHDFRVRPALRFPVKRRNVISEVCRQSITEERDLV